VKVFSPAGGTSVAVKMIFHEKLEDGSIYTYKQTVPAKCMLTHSKPRTDYRLVKSVLVSDVP
jgi:hypothetical protein